MGFNFEEIILVKNVRNLRKILNRLICAHQQLKKFIVINLPPMKAPDAGHA